MVYWRMRYPGWRWAARCGVPIKIRVDACHDHESGMYYATSDDIGLAVEAESLDVLVREIHLALPELLSLAHSQIQKPTADIRLHDELVAA